MTKPKGSTKSKTASKQNSAPKYKGKLPLNQQAEVKHQIKHVNLANETAVLLGILAEKTNNTIFDDTFWKKFALEYNRIQQKGHEARDRLDEIMKSTTQT